MAARDPATAKALIGKVEVKALTEREMRKVRPLFMTSGKDGGADVDVDKMGDAMIVHACINGDGARLVPEGREAEVADLPAGIYQRLVNMVLAVNGDTAASGNS